jgi:hypothetical protein
MGVAQGEFTSVHKDKSAWFDGSSTNPRTQLITASGTYTIEPLETVTNGLKVLKFERASGEFYYVEYRQPINFDKNINSVYHKSLGIHYGTSNSTASWRLKTIGVGGSFVDAIYPNGGLSIKLLSYNASGAQVQVDIGSVPPVTPTPTVVPTKTVNPTVVPTKTATPTPTPTVTPTTPPPGNVVFNVSPGQWVYKYDPTRTIWSSVSVWIKREGTVVVNAPTNYRVYTPANKLYRELNKNTDTNGYIKFGLPIDKTTTVGKYKVVIKTTINKIVYTSEPTYFEVK